MPSQRFFNNSKIHKLKDSRLRKVRFEFRTLIFLAYKGKKRELNLEMGAIRRDKWLDFDSKQESLRRLLKRREELDLYFQKSPISCWFCGDRMKDLTQDSDSLFWFCPEHIRTDR